MSERENTDAPPADPLLAWAPAELERLEEQDEYHETVLLTPEGECLCP